MQADNIVELKHVVQAAWNQKIRILFLSLFIYSGCVLLYLFVTPKFSSLSKWISTSQDPTTASSLQKFSSLLGGNASLVPDDFTNYRDIIVSSEFLKPLLEKKVMLMSSEDSLRLFDVLWGKKHSKKHGEDSLLLLKDPEFIPGMIGVVKGWINFVSKSPVYQLGVSTWDPRLSKSVNQNIIERALEYNRNERLSKSKMRRIFLETQLASFKASLVLSESKLVDFEKRNFSLQNPELYLEKERLLREVKINNQLVVEFRTQYELARVDEDNEAIQLSVIERPSFSIRKVFPGKILFLVGGAFSSLVLSCVMVYVLNLFVAYKSEWLHRST